MAHTGSNGSDSRRADTRGRFGSTCADRDADGEGTAASANAGAGDGDGVGIGGARMWETV
jgi:hypothetical protein